MTDSFPHHLKKLRFKTVYKSDAENRTSKYRPIFITYNFANICVYIRLKLKRLECNTGAEN